MKEEDRRYLVSQRLLTVFGMSLGLMWVLISVFKEWYLSATIIAGVTLIWVILASAYDMRIERRLEG